MILDSSAVVAIILREPGYERLLDAVCSVTGTGIGAPNLVESGIVLSARLDRDARGLLSRFLVESAVLTIPLSDAHWSIAVDAWLRYGKGRHAAGLNFGDCLAYATARVAGKPLLCVGDEYSKTDLDLAD
ncbi:MAG: type II toxin-antitoxin system VapC family toxin [Acidobacteriota bacterium]|nr:type II toxin-antitoxin system VapC family toxin [Acidobacteriota bacterium]